ncbi:hypothetical protein AAVH_43639, partial [Aphelenchoides avenae]
MVDWERVWLKTFTPFTQWITLAVNIAKRPTDRLDDLYRKGIENVPFAGCYYQWNGTFDK